jgi:(5-formylfuran-3-yl)methyl phosphate synthase
MTRLLVSVRDAIEARIALDAGADLIDLKEPARGPLGAVDAAVAADCLRIVDGRVRVSLALGELLDFDATKGSSTPRGAAFVKLGLAGCAECADWPGRWVAARARFAAGADAVAVVYADWRAAAAPTPEEVLDQVSATERTGGLGLDCRACRAVLVDTFDKAGGGLLEQWTLDELSRFARRVRQTGMLLVLAGSLDHKSIEKLLPLDPDYVGVRGAACVGGRVGQLDGDRVRRLRNLVRHEKVGWH